MTHSVPQRKKARYEIKCSNVPRSLNSGCSIQAPLGWVHYCDHAPVLQSVWLRGWAAISQAVRVHASRPELQGVPDQLSGCGGLEGRLTPGRHAPGQLVGNISAARTE